MSTTDARKPLAPITNTKGAATTPVPVTKAPACPKPLISTLKSKLSKFTFEQEVDAARVTQENTEKNKGYGRVLVQKVVEISQERVNPNYPYPPKGDPETGPIEVKPEGIKGVRWGEDVIATDLKQSSPRTAKTRGRKSILV